MRPDHIWLLADLPVVSGLLADGWQLLYRGARSVWLSRPGEATDPDLGVSTKVDRTARTPAPVLGERLIARRCFPGP
jgi:hypothetical protein